LLENDPGWFLPMKKLARWILQEIVLKNDRVITRISVLYRIGCLHLTALDSGAFNWRRRQLESAFDWSGYVNQENESYLLLEYISYLDPYNK